MAAPFTGVGVALVTLFRDDGSLDAAATARLARQLVDAGVHAVVTAGSTGEAAALTPAERTELVAAVKTAVPAVPVIAGTGAPSARQAAELTRAAAANGADAVLALSPPGATDVRRYYDSVADAAADTPVLAYHYPAVSAPGIAVSALADLPVAGCKDSSGDPDRLLATLALPDWTGALYTGSSAILALAGPLGCAGAILALANAEPELCAAAFAGDAGAQRALTPAHLAARASFPAGIKQLTAERFGTSTVTRMG
jgi:dihydrodipicolinate synthase/N-acetylneuraminate lyase